jgi:hypothetical protein
MCSPWRSELRWIAIRPGSRSISCGMSIGYDYCSDAHESSILAEALDLASNVFPRNRLATLERASTVLVYTRPFTPLVFRCATVLETTRRHSPPLASAPPSPTTLDSTRPRLAHSCASLDTMLLLRYTWRTGTSVSNASDAISPTGPSRALAPLVAGLALSSVQ